MAVAYTNNQRCATFATAGDVITGELYVRAIVWSEADTAADTMDVKDGKGKVVFTWSVAAAGDVRSIVFSNPAGMYFNGLEVDVLDSGKVYVFLA